MADDAYIEVAEDNTDEVIRQLGVALATALESTGLVAEGDVKAITPVDTGRLRNSITHAVDPAEKAVIVGTNVEYAVYVENRTSYLVRAVNANQRKYRGILEKALRGR